MGEQMDGWMDCVQASWEMLISPWASQNCSEKATRTTSSQCFFRKGKRALGHKQLDNNLIQLPFLRGDQAIASQIQCPGLATPTWVQNLEVRHQPCPELMMSPPFPLNYSLTTQSQIFFFPFQLEKCFQFLNHFFKLISTPNSPQSFLIVQDNEKQILKKSITPKYISKVEQAPSAKV